MDNQEFGNRIAEARKRNGMTQRDLAERLDVTDKAVSKWECGKGFPEITLLPKLSKVLDIKPEELLMDRITIKNTESANETEEAQAGIVDPQVELVTNVIRYSGEQQYRKLSRLVFPIVSGALAISAFVCALVDFCIARSLTWSRFPLSALLFTFIVLLPVFLLKRHRTAIAAAVFFVGAVPFLLYIESLVPAKGWFLGLALPILAVCAFCTAGVIWLYLYTKIDRLIVTGITFADMGVFLNFIVNGIVLRYLGKTDSNISVFITMVFFGVGAVVLTVIALIKRSKSMKNEESEKLLSQKH